MKKDKSRMKNLLGSITDVPALSPEEEERSFEPALTEEENPAPRDDKAPLSSEVVRELGISPDLEAKLNEVRRSKTGRPKGSKTGTAKERENRATFIVPASLTRKLKYIALAETSLYKDVIARALSAYVEQWEAGHGKIRLPNTTTTQDNESN